MADRRSRQGRGLRDMAVSGMTLYPLAITAWATYWAELAAGASRSSYDLFEAALDVLRSPRDIGQVLREVAGGLQGYLVTAGDITERAILGFNERLEAAFREPDARGSRPAGTPNEGLEGALRGVTDWAMKEMWRLREPGAHVDPQALSQQLEQLLGDIRACTYAGRASPADTGASGSEASE